MTTISDTQTHVLDDIKDSQEITEDKGHDLEEAATLDLVSHHANLSRVQAMRKFWRLFLVGIMVASAGMLVSLHMTIFALTYGSLDQILWLHNGHSWIHCREQR